MRFYIFYCLDFSKILLDFKEIREVQLIILIKREINVGDICFYFFLIMFLEIEFV